MLSSDKETLTLITGPEVTNLIEKVDFQISLLCKYYGKKCSDVLGQTLELKLRDNIEPLLKF